MKRFARGVERLRLLFRRSRATFVAASTLLAAAGLVFAGLHAAEHGWFDAKHQHDCQTCTLAKTTPAEPPSLGHVVEYVPTAVDACHTSRGDKASPADAVYVTRSRGPPEALILL